MTAAIVLSSYNGENYIFQQLQSLLNQTRSPDLVTICDDGSKDATVEIAERFIREHGLKNWTVSVNRENSGWMKNFHDLILSAPTDLIFPCDQDDIWHPTKLEEMICVMKSHPEIDLLACDYDALYDDNTRTITRKITKGMDNSGAIEKPRFDAHFMNVLRPGCTFAVRRSFCEAIAPAWECDLPHDAMLWRTAVVKGSAAILHKNLITWRRYNASSSNPNSAADRYQDKKRMMLDFYAGNCSSHLRYLECLHRLTESGKIPVNAKARRLLRESGDFEQTWRDAMLSHRPEAVVGCLFRYRRFFPSFKTAGYQAYISVTAN